MSEAILVLNSGSSSVKFALYALEGEGVEAVCRGRIEGIGTAPHLSAVDSQGASIADERWDPAPRGQGHALALERLADWARENLDLPAIAAVGHRVVHGGPEFAAPVIVDESVLNTLEALVPLAPLHQPHNLAAIREIAENRPDLVQVACFDTAFHRGRASVTERFGLPDALYREGIQRYGFHGLSYEYIARTLPEVAPAVAEGRVVIAHLGSGASLCAISNGRSVDTTMGFTALDGLPMGTRCGVLDPGVVLYLLRSRGLGVDAVERMLYQDCGLLGISGVSNDMRDLLADDSPRAREAVDYFVYRIARELGSLTAALGGLDALVFTAGIGERSPEIRARVCERSAWLGIEIDAEANGRNESLVSRPGRAPSVWVVPTDEERMIATHVLDLSRRR